METYSTRQNKVSRLVQKELSGIFQKECSHLCQGKMITITVVRMSPDLSLAKVYLSIYPTTKTKETLDLMNADKKQIRLELGKKIRHQLRITPELAFFIDDSLDYLDKINTLLKK
jgi:ribosome-binding factor A